MFGGLNFQVEHHLFPSIAHTRLPEICPLIRDYCKKHGVKYFEYHSVWEVYRAHIKLLDILGNYDSLEDWKKSN